MKNLSQCLVAVGGLAKDEASGLQLIKQIDVTTESGCVNAALRS